MMIAVRHLPIAVALSAVPAAAQDTATGDAANTGGRVVIDLMPPPPPEPVDPEAARQCEEEADAARIAGEIVVCRAIGESTDGYWNQEDFIRRYAEVTQGVKAPDVDGTGLPFGMFPYIDIRGCFIPPCPAEPALMIDVESLPEAPAGSDADRIARGLPPLEKGQP